MNIAALVQHTFSRQRSCYTVPDAKRIIPFVYWPFQSQLQVRNLMTPWHNKCKMWIGHYVGWWISSEIFEERSAVPLHIFHAMQLNCTWSLESHIKATIGFKIPKTSTEHMQSLKPIETLKQVLVLLIKIESWVVKGTIQKVSTLNSSTRENKKVRTFWTTIHKFHILHVTQKRHSKLHHSFTSMISASWSMMCCKLITQDLMPMKQGQWVITSPRTPVRAWQYPSLSSCHGDLLQISEWMSI